MPDVMSYARFHALLRQTIGLDPASIGSAMIERAVRARQAASGAAGLDAYWERVRASETELQQLVEAVVVPETWFFRGRPAFVALARLAREQALRAPGRRLRLLSLPCSTGEEAYSIAMALLDAGLADAQFQIDAVDICHRSLAVAERALYGRNSFRGGSLDFRARHFMQAGDKYRLSDAVRRQVRFQQGNLFGPGLLAGETPYDFIFCRNLLIYFDRPMQQRAIALLGKLLSGQGTLFAGPAEGGLLVGHGMAPAGMEQAFAFRKPGGNPPAVRLAPVLTRLAPASLPVTAIAPPAPARVQPLPPKRPAAPAAVPGGTSLEAALPKAVIAGTDTLEIATQLADRGRLGEAAALCRQHIALQGPSAAAHCLLGLICDAGGDPAGACVHYRKALYLDPGHREALAYLAVLLDMQGDAAGAARLAERARRAQAGGAG
jgi:chemotaxis protein methyltransferase WspC